MIVIIVALVLVGFVLLSYLIGGLYIRYRYYKFDSKPLLPEKVTAHIIDQPGGEYVRVLSDSDRPYDHEGDEWP